MPALADRLNEFKVSASVIMGVKARELAAQGIKVISLNAGEPDFPTPDHAVEAAHQAAHIRQVGGRCRTDQKRNGGGHSIRLSGSSRMVLNSRSQRAPRAPSTTR